MKDNFNLTNISETTINVNLQSANASSGSVYGLTNWDYIFVAYITPPLIILFNSIVVISSGLILKKVQQRKSMYLLLGNVSLADLTVGIATVLRVVGPTKIELRTHPLCIIQIASLQGPTIVSTLTVAMIAIDRYIFILHGMYYQKWVTTSRVRWTIVWTWIIGMSLVLLPITGWVKEETDNKCLYLSIYPRKLILMLLSTTIVSLCIMPVLYIRILVTALRNLKSLQSSDHKHVKKTKNIPKIMKDGNVIITTEVNHKIDKVIDLPKQNSNENTKNRNSLEVADNLDTHSVNSFQTSDTEITNVTSSTSSVNVNTQNSKPKPQPVRKNNTIKHKRNVRYRGIAIVLLTSGAFIATLMPFAIVEVIYLLGNNEEICDFIRYKIRGTVTTLTILNHLLNPLIYAWWHEGFQRFVKNYYHLLCTKLKNL